MSTTPTNTDAGKALADFARWVIQNSTFEGSSLDGDDVQQKAVDLGLLLPTTYDPAKHGPSDSAEPGMEWFTFAGALAATPQPGQGVEGDAGVPEDVRALATEFAMHIGNGSLQNDRKMIESAILADRASRPGDGAMLLKVKLLEEFASSFHISVNSSSFYKDTSLHLDRPHSLMLRLRNDSTQSWLFADLEARRLAALASEPAPVEPVAQPDADVRAAQSSRVAIVVALGALRDIAGFGTPDQPATSPLTELAYVQRHVGTLRGIADTALASIKSILGDEGGRS